MLLLTNIGQLLTVRGPAAPRRGLEMSELGIIAGGAVLCSGSKIVAAGKRNDVASEIKRHGITGQAGPVREINCEGRVVIPGFVDSHTHPAFITPRLIDFEQRISGATYEDIAQRGGGIHSSVHAVRKASAAMLAASVLRAFEAMNQHGATTIEAKSGYGLDLNSEIKSLKAIRAAAGKFGGTVVATLLGAHVVPREFAQNRQEYVRLVCDEMIPAATGGRKTRNSKIGTPLASFVDVFCERGAFSVAETRLIFEAARRHGLGVRAHLCQLSPAAVADLLEFDPASLDHMECVAESDLPLLARSNTVATLLPGADYFLGLTSYAPARRFIDSGIAIALATDFNPGTSPTLSMPMVLSLACTQMQMSPAEAITAATVNGAAALRLADSKGSIEPGKDADLAIFDVRDYREIAYWFGDNRCWAVVNRGRFRRS